MGFLAGQDMKAQIGPKGKLDCLRPNNFFSKASMADSQPVQEWAFLSFLANQLHGSGSVSYGTVA